MAAAARNAYANEAGECDAFLAEIDGMSAISFTLVTGIMLDSFNGFGSNRAYYTALAKRSIDPLGVVPYCEILRADRVLH